jgi:hypothetical protein
MARVLKPDMEPGEDQLKAYVFSVAPYVAHMKVFGFGPTVHVAPRKHGERYSRTDLNQATCFKDYGENQKEVFVVDPLDMAQDIINDCPGQGLWAGRAPTPSEEDILAAEAKQTQFYKDKIEEADGDWARKQDPKSISFHARVGARELNVKRDWAKDTSSLLPCKGCKELISVDAVKCGRCGAVLDWERAQALGLVTEEQVRFALKRNLTGSAEPAPAKKAKTA